MRAILINPTTRHCETVILSAEARESFAPMYGLLGCDTCEMVTLGRGIAMVIDEEGLLKSPGAFFRVGLAPYPFAGNALLLGTDDEGAFCDLPARLTLSLVASHITWVPLADVRAFRDRGGFDGSMTTARGVQVLPFRPKLADESPAAPTDERQL